MRLLILFLLTFCIGEANESDPKIVPKWFECGAEKHTEWLAWHVLWYFCRPRLLKINRCCVAHDACYKRGRDRADIDDETAKMTGAFECNHKFDMCLYDEYHIIDGPAGRFCYAVYSGFSAIVWAITPLAYKG
ncbi:hypothetical protein PRIPAC_75513 [Pristionchus pacificus]|uniref:Uncharacterized protein n=1 Tax=Pristionchus pacificus TaxID=54126 RepID=A0A454Y2N8_PRIPA|nr:hypothetical protein PRIPAC_75513 [Pristionchus pacificus]|eukprot:PDM74542.1 hypothetical protein PRIPAC_41898 [Pristionchus pacificus]